MPFINVKTNAAVPADKAEAIKAGLGQAITAVPGKTEAWLMVAIEGDKAVWFKGTDAPAAMVEVSLMGAASSAALTDMTGRITDLLTDTLGLPADRIYVSYFSTDHWGWNGSNF